MTAPARSAKRRFIVKYDNCGCWSVRDRKDEFYYARFDNRLAARRHAQQKNREDGAR